MDRRFTGLAAAIGLAGVGTFVLVGYVQAAEDRALAGEELVPVLVVDEPIAQGTTAEALAGSVRTEQVPAKVRPADAVTDLAALDGLAASTDLVPGEQLLATRFGDAAAVNPVAVLDGLREVTLELSIARAGGGRILPGHRVDVLSSRGDAASLSITTEVVLEDVPVVAAVIQESEAVSMGTSEDEGPTGAPETQALVTLAVAPEDAPALITAAEGQLVWLARTPSVEHVRS